ncbi:glycosyltransferase family 2 protein [Chishuiella changwenlii]|uniref:glycosyltransferase family 2 protein n=1 Tax=Chishuiella changwenlii TaxID=1434701 RepID=UPI002FD99761
MKNYNIIILNWNGWRDTENCIKSIRNKNISQNYTIILVDNGSDQEEINLIEAYCKNNFNQFISNDKEYFLNKEIVLPKDFIEVDSKDRIILIKNNENLGFAIGNNVALKFLQNLSAPYALLLNNDTEVENDALEKMFNYLIKNEDKDIVAVVPQIRYFNPSNVIWNCGGSINWLGVRKYDYALSNISNVPQVGSKKIDYGTGCAILLNINETGILSEKYFFGEEDFELAYRLKKKNKKLFCLYDSIVYHKVGVSREKISEKKMGNMVFHYSMRMSNLKNQLTLPIWYLSFFAHYLSTIRILRKETYFSLNKINCMWKDVYKNVKTIDVYTREDFIRISNKKY